LAIDGDALHRVLPFFFDEVAGLCEHAARAAGRAFATQSESEGLLLPFVIAAARSAAPVFRTSSNSASVRSRGKSVISPRSSRE
jgi:hypothetical protein